VPPASSAVPVSAAMMARLVRISGNRCGFIAPVGDTHSGDLNCGHSLWMFRIRFHPSRHLEQAFFCAPIYSSVLRKYQ
jgi:hypothetical protein